jgi:hypothetical protein
MRGEKQKTSRKELLSLMGLKEWIYVLEFIHKYWSQQKGCFVVEHESEGHCTLFTLLKVQLPASRSSDDAVLSS